MRRLRLVSDLHLEFYHTLAPVISLLTGTPPGMERPRYLALCGDIGIPYHPLYKEFLSWADSNYEHVFLVAGNHEYYHSWKTIGEIDNDIEDIVCPLSNVTFLRDRGEDFMGLRVYGTTLWSHVGVSLRVKNGMNDYLRINKKEGGWRKNISLKDMNNMHDNSVKGIQAEIDTCKGLGMSLVVLSHHLPSFQLVDPKYERHPLTEAFASDLDRLIAPPVTHWLFGHSHTVADKVINGVRCVANPLGYVGEDSGFRGDMVLDL